MKKWVFGLALVLLALVLAKYTPAGTEIRNQASASYIDSAGQPQVTTSNEVVTVVQAVYGFEIKPDGADKDSPGQIKTGLAGAPVYFNYTVTNTGNTSDTISLDTSQETSDNFDFASTNIYLDANCNGQVDPGEATVSSVTLAADASACVVVEAAIPADRAPGDYGNLNLEGTSQGDITKTDTDNWARAVVTANAVLSATKSASPTGAVAPGDTITYTISGSNTGGSPAYGISVTVDGSSTTGILIEDTIPSGLKVESMPTGSAGAGTITYVYDSGSGWQTLESSNLPLTGDDTSPIKIGMLIEGSDAFFPVGAQYTFSFSATVPSDAQAGASYENTATVSFNDGSSDQEVSTNTTTNTVATVAGVQNGPNGDPDADGSGFNGSYTDPSGKTWTFTETTDTTDPRDDDAETISDSVYGGDTIYFPFTLQNAGNGPDTYTLSVSIVDPDTTDSADPTTWVCQVVAPDGTTPINGSIGPIEPGHTYDYIVKCAVPAGYEETGTSDAAHIEVTATSGNDPSVTNKVTGIVTDVQSGYAVDVAQHGNAGDNDSSNDNPPATSANPGDTVLFPFDVYNAGQNPDTYDLSATPPAGFTGTIYPDADCDGAMDSPTPAPVTDTGLMNPGDTKCFILSIEVPAGQTPIDLDGTPGTSDDNVKITATSHADPSKKDTISTDLEVNAVAALAFTPDRSGTVTSPGTIVYAHTVTNNGNEAASVTFAVSGTTHSGWTYQISTDGGSTWKDPASASIGSLAAGASQEVRVRVIVPDGEPIGAVDAVQVTATGTFASGGTASASVTDTTTVVGGDLRLEKQVDKASAKPGETLTYTITATNIGTADLKQVIVSDPLPGYTDFVSVSATATGFPSGSQVVYSTDGSSWSASAPTSLSAGQAIYVAVDTNSDTNITDADTMPPAAKITIVFKVKVQ